MRKNVYHIKFHLSLRGTKHKSLWKSSHPKTTKQGKKYCPYWVTKKHKRTSKLDKITQSFWVSRVGIRSFILIPLHSFVISLSVNKPLFYTTLNEEQRFSPWLGKGLRIRNLTPESACSQFFFIIYVILPWGGTRHVSVPETDWRLTWEGSRRLFMQNNIFPV